MKRLNTQFDQSIFLNMNNM